MTSDVVKQVLYKRRFDPFKVILSSGESIDVSDPENAVLVKGGLHVVYRSKPEEEFPDRWRTISFLHIVTLDAATNV